MKKFFSKGVKLVLGQRTGFSECLTLIEIWRQWEKRSTSDSLLSLSDSLLQSCERLSGDGSLKKKKAAGKMKAKETGLYSNLFC